MSGNEDDKKRIPLERLAALLPIAVAGVCTAVGIATSGWGYPTKTPPIDPTKTRLLPPPSLVDGRPPPPKTLITATKNFRMVTSSSDAGSANPAP